ncbi:MAG: LysR family transcriptional regulator [Alphaproteobacteria bacterium]|nr:LysR family transcriptional regulator [Alphaproteobacteria bacterium]
MDELGNIRAFLRVVETGGVSTAAKQLNIAKSAVSRRIKELEGKLGADLLVRGARSVRPTETGLAFYQRCLRIVADLDEAEAAATEAHEELAGVIRIAAPLAFGLLHLQEPIIAFAQRNRRVSLELDLADHTVDLIATNTDLALRIGRLDDSDLIARKLAPIRAVIAAHPDYWARHGKPSRPEDLRDHACLTYSGLAEPTAWIYRGPNGENGSVRVRSRLQANNGLMLRQAALSGLGVVCQPTFINGAALKEGRLEQALANYRWRGSDLFAVYPPTRRLSRRVRAFIDHLVEAFAGPPDWDAGLPP